MEYSQILEQNCRIIVAEPDDLTSFAAAKTVCKQRGESLGQSVGCVLMQNLRILSASSLITFCSYKILLKNLMGISNESALLNTITHIIIVTFHEQFV
jgi:HrpA-like RNA helicase